MASRISIMRAIPGTEEYIVQSKENSSVLKIKWFGMFWTIFPEAMLVSVNGVNLGGWMFLAGWIILHST